MQEESYGLKKIVVRALRENTLIERVAVVISRGAGRGAAQALEPCFGCAHAHGSTGGPLCLCKHAPFNTIVTLNVLGLFNLVRELTPAQTMC